MALGAAYAKGVEAAIEKYAAGTRLLSRVFNAAAKQVRAPGPNTEKLLASIKTVPQGAVSGHLAALHADRLIGGPGADSFAQVRSALDPWLPFGAADTNMNRAYTDAATARVFSGRHLPPEQVGVPRRFNQAAQSSDPNTVFKAGLPPSQGDSLSAAPAWVTEFPSVADAHQFHGLNRIKEPVDPNQIALRTYDLSEVPAARMGPRTPHIDVDPRKMSPEALAAAVSRPRSSGIGRQVGWERVVDAGALPPAKEVYKPLNTPQWSYMRVRGTGTPVVPALVSPPTTKAAGLFSNDDPPPWAVPAGVAAGSLVGLGGVLAAKPALRAHLMGSLKGIGHGGSHAAAEQAARQAGTPPAVVEQAKQIVDQIKARGLDPQKLRIGISATGGTGKTTLARELAQQLGYKTHGLGIEGKDIHSRSIGEHVLRHGVEPGRVVEQTHLLNQVDPDIFDLVVKLEKPYEDIQKQMIARQRGAGQLDFYDYPKLQRAIAAGFEHTHGPAIQLGDTVSMKFRPEGGFGAKGLLEKKLRAEGLDPTGLSREEQLIALAQGSRPLLPGKWNYARLGDMATGAATIGGLGALGGWLGSQLGS